MSLRAAVYFTLVDFPAVGPRASRRADGSTDAAGLSLWPQRVFLPFASTVLCVCVFSLSIYIFVYFLSLFPSFLLSFLPVSCVYSFVSICNLDAMYCPSFNRAILTSVSML